MPYNKNAKRRASALITGVEIENLFGRYDYDLKIPRTESNNVSQIGIIYGDNGTGKTTILRLLFHLLSPANDREHRTFLAQVPFSRFSVTFSDKIKISVVREDPNFTGPYNITLTKAGRSALTAEIDLDKDGSVIVPPEGERILNEIDNRQLSIFLLSDDRMLQSDESENDLEERYREEIRYSELVGLSRRIAPNRRDVALRQSLERTTTWLRRRLIQKSTRGEAEAQQIYPSIIERLNKLGVPPTQDYEAERNSLIQALKDLDKRSHLIAKFGLISKVDVKPFIKGLTDTSQRLLPFVAQVVSPFIDGQKVRLDALEELYGPLDRFVTRINGFFVDKKIDLKAGEGISILSDSGIRLDPENLSSGEKQLLLLFCNVLTSSESASLFIIDEPEISLNVKWQRRLVDALVDITSGSQCQFLLATHSIELLSKHRNQVIKLNPS